jgi:hypothetical protein
LKDPVDKNIQLDTIEAKSADLQTKPRRSEFEGETHAGALKALL